MSITLGPLLSSPWPKKEDMSMIHETPVEKQNGESAKSPIHFLTLRTSLQKQQVISTARIIGSQVEVTVSLGLCVLWSSIRQSIVVSHERLVGCEILPTRVPQITFVDESNIILIFAKEIRLLTNSRGDGCLVLEDFRS